MDALARALARTVLQEDWPPIALNCAETCEGRVDCGCGVLLAHVQRRAHFLIHTGAGAKAVKKCLEDTPGLWAACRGKCTQTATLTPSIPLAPAASTVAPPVLPKQSAPALPPGPPPRPPPKAPPKAPPGPPPKASASQVAPTATATEAAPTSRRWGKAKAAEESTVTTPPLLSPDELAVQKVMTAIGNARPADMARIVQDAHPRSYRQLVETIHAEMYGIKKTEVAWILTAAAARLSWPDAVKAELEKLEDAQSLIDAHLRTAMAEANRRLPTARPAKIGPSSGPPPRELELMSESD